MDCFGGTPPRNDELQGFVRAYGLLRPLSQSRNDGLGGLLCELIGRRGFSCVSQKFPKNPQNRVRALKIALFSKSQSNLQINLIKHFFIHLKTQISHLRVCAQKYHGAKINQAQSPKYKRLAHLSKAPTCENHHEAAYNQCQISKNPSWIFFHPLPNFAQN